MSTMSQRNHLIDSDAWRVVGRSRRRLNSSRNSASHWSVTKCDFQDLEPFFWRLEVQAEDKDRVLDANNAQ
ncbi:hypothetical protein TNCV_2460921 [Trichonephila clavipes]|nr:hypothetical protein TNCV_2460921 [Trichonephila clavipes]